jgi:hypothetical protein
MGRHGDTILMHINEKELMGLAGLGKITGHNITINPETGLPEAFSFGNLLPWILGAAAIALTAGAATPAVAAAEGAAAAGTGVAAAATPAIAAAGTTAAEAAAAGTAASAVPAAVGGTAGGIGALGGSAATMTPEAIAAANAAATAPIAYTPLAAPVAETGAISGGTGSASLFGGAAAPTTGVADTLTSTVGALDGNALDEAMIQQATASTDGAAANITGGAEFAPGATGAPTNIVPEVMQPATNWLDKGFDYASKGVDWAIKNPVPTAMGLSMIQSILPGQKQKGQEDYDPRKHPIKSMPYGQTKNARYSSPGAGYNASFEHSFFPGYNAFNGYDEGGPVAPAPESGGNVQEFLAGLQANAGSPADFIAQLASNPKTRTLLPMIEQIMKGTQPQRINRQSSMDTPVEQRRGYKKGGSVSRAEQDAINKAIEDRIAPHNWSNGDAMGQDPEFGQLRMGPWWSDNGPLPSGRNPKWGGTLDETYSNEDVLYAALNARNRAQYNQAQRKGDLYGFNPELKNTVGYNDLNPNQLTYYDLLIKNAQRWMKEEGRGPGGGYADGGAVAPQSGGGYGYSQADGQGNSGFNMFNPLGSFVQRSNGIGSKGTQDQGSPATPPPVSQPQPFSINTDQWVADFGPDAVNRMGYTPSQTPGWRSQIPVNSGPLVMRQPMPMTAPPVQQQGPIFNQRPMMPAVNQRPNKRMGRLGMRGMAEGGEVMDGIHPDEQAGSDQVVAAVIQAIQEGGQSPESQQAIAAFVQMFGQAALTDLIKRVQAMQSDSPFRAPDGSLSGPGDGQSDSIPAVIDGQAPAALSTGEHVIDKLTVDAAGGGDNAAGHQALNKIKEGLRTKAYGAPQLPQPGNVNRILRG